MTDREIVALMFYELRRQAREGAYDAPWVSDYEMTAAEGGVTVQVDGDVNLTALLAVVKAALQ